MSTGNHQGNKLFLVCPFCQMENFIVKHYGEVFFLTVPAAIFNVGSEELGVIKEFITRENIRGIYLVSETSCNFAKNVLDNTNHSELPWETEIRKLKSADGTWYVTPADLQKDLDVIKESLLESGMVRIAEDLLFPIERKLQCFGFHLAALDIRQNSAFHEKAIEQLLKAASFNDWEYSTWDEKNEWNFLTMNYKVTDLLL
jgi:hypothetical protein